MSRTNYAAIDIGSNAVRLLIKSIDSEAQTKDKFKKIQMVRVPLRLGFDIFSTGVLSERKADKLCRLMKAFRHLMRVYDVAAYRACATSAMRDAQNGIEVIQRIEKNAGIRVEIIDGKEEAAIIYSNHIERSNNGEGAYLYVDVGGGSTEVNFIRKGRLQLSRSYNIGTVRMLTGKVRDDEWSRLETDLAPLRETTPQRICIIGSGGNINKLFKMARLKDPQLESLPVSMLRDIRDSLAPLPVEQRMAEYSLKEDRADVIVPAADVFLRIASVVRAERIEVPVIGLADGIIDELFLKRSQKGK